jgi:hypothetical protein
MTIGRGAGALVAGAGAARGAAALRRVLRFAGLRFALFRRGAGLRRATFFFFFAAFFLPARFFAMATSRQCLAA